MTAYFELCTRLSQRTSRKCLEYILSASFVNISQQIKFEEKTRSVCRSEPWYGNVLNRPTVLLALSRYLWGQLLCWPRVSTGCGEFRMLLTRR